LLAILALPFVGGCEQRAVDSPPAQLGREITQWVDGAETNGFYARVSLHWPHGVAELPLISVIVLGTSNGLAANPSLPNRPHDWFEPGFTYYVSSGGLPGPMELKDAAAHPLPAVKESMVSAGRFPAGVRFSDLYRQQQMKKGIRSLRMPEPLIKRATALPALRLQDLFTVEKPGAYRLTIFAKIYKKSESNGDLLQRIDLPPVAVPFRYEPLH